MRQIFLATLLMLIQGSALAYIGPGLGAGVIGVILGILASVLLAVVAIFWYPIKRLFRGKPKKAKPGDRERRDEDPDRD